MRGVFRSSWERLLGKTDSPIEGAFLEAFCVQAIEHGYEVSKHSKGPAWGIVVKPQQPFGERYIADFIITYPFFGATFTVVVECDGHEFHERTKKQAAHDRRRDRACQALGYRIMRFTGSELHADASGCAYEVLDAIMEFQTATFLKAIEEAEVEEAA